MNYINNYIHFGYGTNTLLYAVPFVVLLLLWSIFWKGLALWHAAKRGEKIWFIVFLLLNTVGVVEILYLVFVAKIKFSNHN